MWGDWMDKAKDLAANLDKQINESVGVDQDPTSIAPAAMPTPAPMPFQAPVPAAQTPMATMASLPFQKVAPAPSPVPQQPSVVKLDANNAWNDDDDFAGFDDDFGTPEATKEVNPTPKLAVPVPKPAAPAQPSAPAPPEAGSKASATTLISPKKLVVPTPTKASPQPPSVPPPAPAATEVPNESPVDMDKDVSDDQYSNEDKKEEQEEVLDLQSPTPAPVPPPEVSTPSSMLSSLGLPTGKPADSSPARTPKALAAATNMFSSFASRAEALAHQAEHLVDKAVHRDERDEQPSEDPATDTDPQSDPLLSPDGQSTQSLNEVAQEDTDAIDDNQGWDGDEGELDFDTAHEEVEAEDVAASKQTEEDKERESVAAAEPEAVEPMPPTDPEPSIPEPTPEPTAIEPEEHTTMNTPPAPAPTPEVEPPTPNEETTLIPTVSGVPEPTETLTPPAAAPTPAPINIEDDPRFQELKQQLTLREDQLANKSMQLTELQTLMESQEQELRQKIADTKEEAKKRILRAKDRFEASEAKLQSLQTAGAADSAGQSQIIQALREEGEKLAMKQSHMEQSVRAAKSESRDLKEQLEEEQKAKTQGLERIAKLETDLKDTKELLMSARKGESQAGKLEQDYLSARADADLKAGTILSLQQQVKELSDEGKELQTELQRVRKVAAKEAHDEQKSLRRAHNNAMGDWETKLKTTEREAGLREDALRHELAELRKRWQDAVRRSDALSMDVQSSTAPLLRQLESMERQNRTRAANWTELENRLRSELEETVIQNETLSKERSEFKTKYTRMERSVGELQQELNQSKQTIEDQTSKLSKLESHVDEMEEEAEKRQEEYSKVERLANEGVMRVRSEMTQTVVDSEERYRGQIEKLEGDLRVEREKRSQLEDQVDQMLENAGMIVPPQAQENMIRREAKPQRLKKPEGQAQILAGALGFESDSDDEEDVSLGHPMDRGDSNAHMNHTASMGSFAALEQLTSTVKASKVELEALRGNLRESETAREALLEELGQSRTAKEKLPLFEAKVKELAQETREKDMEIRGLQDDIAEVKEMYRTQLNVLLEEKAASAPNSNGVASAEEPSLSESETVPTTDG